MDLTTLFAAISLAFGLLTFETIRTSDRVIVEVADLPRIERTSIDQVTVEQEFAEQLNRVAKVISVILPPEVRTQREVGLGKAIGSLLKINDLAYAIEADFGYTPDRMRLAMFTDNNRLGAVVSGKGKRVGQFRLTVYPNEGESLIEFVRRCSLIGASHLAPYGTTLYLLQEGARTSDLSGARRLSERAKVALPDTPESFERSLLENVDGLIALFDQNVDRAHELFQQSVRSSARNPAAALNAAFTEIQRNEYAQAEERMRVLLAMTQDNNDVLISTVHMTRGAALLGLRRFDEAHDALQTATRVNPENSSAWFLLAEASDRLGDTEAARRLRRQAFQTNDSLENYAEVAALYFSLSWKDNMPLTESPFRNPEVATVR